MKNKKEEIKEEKCNCGCEENNCNCNSECNCGCNEGEPCTCGDECSCSEEEHTCNGSCEGCHGCGDIDDETLINLLVEKNRNIEEKYMRLQAEYLNYKTRTQGEVSRMLKYEGEEFIKQILQVKDNFERAIVMDNNDLADEVSKFLSGFKMILGNLTTILDNYEVKEIDCLGMEFDPTKEEAVLTEHDEAKPANVVLEVLTKGYTYKDKVIRHACVKVNK